MVNLFVLFIILILVITLTLILRINLILIFFPANPNLILIIIRAIMAIVTPIKWISPSPVLFGYLTVIVLSIAF